MGRRRSAATDASSHLSAVEKGLPHIFLADLHTGATRVITKSVRRGLANGASGKPKMSSDGRFVVFQSEASDLVAAEDFNLLWDVFVFDRTTGTMTRVSGDAEGEWMEPSAGPSIDARGSVVAFSSRHPTDVSDKRNDFDLYVVTVGYPNTVAYPNTEARRHGGTRRSDFWVFLIFPQQRFRSQSILIAAIHYAIYARDQYRDVEIDQEAERFVQ